VAQVTMAARLEYLAYLINSGSSFERVIKEISEKNNVVDCLANNSVAVDDGCVPHVTSSAR
jgi:hypothetical protein